MKRNSIKKPMSAITNNIYDSFENRICKNCIYYREDCNICDGIGWDDPDIKSNNGKGFGLQIEYIDDQGLEVRLRVDEDFGCNNFKSKK